MYPMINRSDLKTQAKEELLRYIDTLNLDKGNKLPNEDELSRMVGVSRITIRAALHDLAAEGIVFRRQGKGTFVNRVFKDIKVSFNPVLPFAEMIENTGHTPSMQLLGIEEIKANAELAAALAIKENATVILSQKIYYADGKLCAICKDYIDKRIIPSAELHELSHYKGTIFQFLYQYADIKVEWDKVELCVANADQQLKNLSLSNPDADLPSKDFLLLKGINYDTEDKPIAYINEYVNTDIIQFNMIRKRIISYFNNK